MNEFKLLVLDFPLTSRPKVLYQLNPNLHQQALITIIHIVNESPKSGHFWLAFGRSWHNRQDYVTKVWLSPMQTMDYYGCPIPIKRSMKLYGYASGGHMVVQVSGQEIPKIGVDT